MEALGGTCFDEIVREGLPIQRAVRELIFRERVLRLWEGTINGETEGGSIVGKSGNRSRSRRNRRKWSGELGHTTVLSGFAVKMHREKWGECATRWLLVKFKLRAISKIVCWMEVIMWKGGTYWQRGERIIAEAKSWPREEGMGARLLERAWSSYEDFPGFRQIMFSSSCSLGVFLFINKISCSLMKRML